MRMTSASDDVSLERMSSGTSASDEFWNVSLERWNVSLG